MKIIIIEDEPLTSETLGSLLLELNSGIEILNVLTSVEEAVGFFRETSDEADLIFSDIKLGDGNSFAIFREVAIRAPVVFCTAYDSYALEAFQVNGIDYLLKPFSKQHLSQALNKFMKLRERFSGQPVPVFSLPQSLEQPVPRAILVYKGNDIIPVSIDKVACFFVSNELVYLVTTDNKQYRLDKKLEELQVESGASFFRVNRQYLVNRPAIVRIIRDNTRKLHLTLSVPTNGGLVVSKARVSQFLSWLKTS